MGKNHVTIRRLRPTMLCTFVRFVSLENSHLLTYIACLSTLVPKLADTRLLKQGSTRLYNSTRKTLFKLMTPHEKPRDETFDSFKR